MPQVNQGVPEYRRAAMTERIIELLYRILREVFGEGDAANLTFQRLQTGIRDCGDESRWNWRAACAIATVPITKRQNTLPKAMYPSSRRTEWLGRRRFLLASTAPMSIGETAQHIDKF
jgi:hypothetical protein